MPCSTHVDLKIARCTQLDNAAQIIREDAVHSKRDVAVYAELDDAEKTNLYNMNDAGTLGAYDINFVLADTKQVNLGNTKQGSLGIWDITPATRPSPEPPPTLHIESPLDHPGVQRSTAQVGVSRREARHFGKGADKQMDAVQRMISRRHAVAWARCHRDGQGIQLGTKQVVHKINHNAVKCKSGYMMPLDRNHAHPPRAARVCQGRVPEKWYSPNDATTQCSASKDNQMFEHRVPFGCRTQHTRIMQRVQFWRCDHAHRLQHMKYWQPRQRDPRVPSDRRWANTCVRWHTEITVTRQIIALLLRITLLERRTKCYGDREAADSIYDAFDSNFSAMDSNRNAVMAVRNVAKPDLGDTTCAELDGAVCAESDHEPLADLDDTMHAELEDTMVVPADRPEANSPIRTAMSVPTSTPEVKPPILLSIEEPAKNRPPPEPPPTRYLSCGAVQALRHVSDQTVYHLPNRTAHRFTIRATNGACQGARNAAGC